MYKKCNQWLGGWKVSLPGILGGFETRQKQIFYIFGTREKIRNFFFQEKSGFFGKYRYFIEKYRYLSEKSAIFRRFFYFRFFHPKIFSSTAENRFFAEKSVEKTDFFVHGWTYEVGLILIGWVGFKVNGLDLESGFWS